VAHRRAEKARERWVEYLSIAPLETSADYLVSMRTEHGTYVKEAISGENGASRPSLSELLGVPCRCVELDVLEILDEQGEAAAALEQPDPFGAGLD
jgi:tRNA pseudouridine synthase 10